MTSSPGSSTARKKQLSAPAAPQVMQMSPGDTSTPWSTLSSLARTSRT